MTGRITLALAALALGGAAPAPPTPMRDPTVADRAYIAATDYHAIKRYLAHAEALPPNYDLQARYRAYLAKALAAPDWHAFSLATMRLFASLRNEHTAFYDDNPRAQTVEGQSGSMGAGRSRPPSLPRSRPVTSSRGSMEGPWTSGSRLYATKSARPAPLTLTA